MFEKISGLFGVLKPLEALSSLLIRVPFAAIFLYHGIFKFVSGIEIFAANLSGAGAFSMPLAVLVAIAEILAGTGVLIGAFKKDALGDTATRLAGIAAAPVLIGAIVMYHWGRWSFVPQPPLHPIGGMEFQVLLLCLAAYFMIKGNDA